MKIKHTIGERVFNLFNTLLMLLVSLVTLYPMLYVVFASFSQPDLFMLHQGPLWHSIGFSTLPYQTVFQNASIWTGYLNTIIVVVCGTALSIFLTVLGAYVLAQKCMLNGVISLLIVFTMYFSGGMIPSFLLVHSLHLNDTLFSLFVPVAVSTYNLIIMRTAFAAIPKSLEESAELDGANQFTILFRIMIPLAAPTVAVLVLFYGVGYWNSWFSALLYLRNNKLYPLQLVLRQIILLNDTSAMSGVASNDQAEYVSETIKYACIVVATVPMLVLYPFLQKYFTKGVMIGAIKE